jgi:sortase (surface protein transpeptidase)
MKFLDNRRASLVFYEYSMKSLLRASSVMCVSIGVLYVLVVPTSDRAYVAAQTNIISDAATSTTQQPQQHTPPPPIPVSIQKSEPQQEPPQPQPLHPVRIQIPAINLDDPVIGVGVNSKGEMDVPSGKTHNVGWYKNGTMPGSMGSAVMDAHVFAAFSQLYKLHQSDEIDIVMSDGSTLKFVVVESHTYPLSDVPAQKLFNSNDGRYLNLITCAGSLVADHSTYDHRLIVYAALQ